jgi:pilus assembly protein CpaB
MVMGQKRPLIFLGFAVGIALVTTVLIYQWLQGQQGSEPEVQAVVEFEGTGIAVASVDVPWGTALTAELIRFVDYPDGSLPTGHFQEPEKVEGRVVIANLKKNEPIMESKLAPIDLATGGVSAVMDPQKRAMAVKVNEVVGLPGFVKPGDRVDVMVTFNQPGKSKDPQITKVVLENTLVLATGTQMERVEGEEPKPVKVLTLEVTLEESEKLAMAENGGKIHVALRSPLNPEIQKTMGAKYSDLLKSYQLKPPPKKFSKPKDRVEVINGTKRTTLKF